MHISKQIIVLNYGPPKPGLAALPHLVRECLQEEMICKTLPTKVVDNFVGKLWRRGREAAPNRARDKTMKN
jgi:hypothetical protein